MPVPMRSLEAVLELAGAVVEEVLVYLAGVALNLLELAVGGAVPPRAPVTVPPTMPEVN